ncbi:hypothetical protein [Phocaeicola sp.]
MKKGFLYAMALTGVLATSCSNRDNLYDSDYANKQYEANWESAIGTIDPNQTWNTAASRSVDISVDYGTNEAYTIKVYTSDPRNTTVDSYLLAEYTVQDGSSKTIQFDAPSVLGTVYVACVDAEGNRIVQSATVNEEMTVDFSLGATSRADEGSVAGMKEFFKEDCEEFLDIIPEGKNNKGKVAQDFKYKSVGKFTVYPMYSVTAGKNKLGLYYYEGGEKKEKYIWDASNSGIEAYKNDEWSSYTISGNSPWKDKGITKLRAKGIVVDLPLDTDFGFYIETEDGTKYYSDSSLNGGKSSLAATFYVGKDLYLGFEDWDHPTSDFDFNDVVCYLAPTHPIIIDKDPVKDKKMQYRIAYEDLGGTNDFDFNDVVLGIEYVSGQSEATVKLLAAGGILPVSVSYDGKVVFEEVHAAFGVSTATMINTGYAKAEPVSATISVNKDVFSMVYQASKFTIAVTREGAAVTEISVPDQKGEAPQAFVVADPNWEWPAETELITAKYEGFAKWASNLKEDMWYSSTWGDEKGAISDVEK